VADDIQSLDEERTPSIPDSWVQRFVAPRSSPAYNRVTLGFVLGSLCHLWLADVWQSSWLFANLAYVLGVLILARWRSALGWFLSALGLAIPLFFLRDQLSQSAFFLCFAASASVLFTGCDRSQTGAAAAAFLRVCRGLTIAAYLLAALHKVNRDFLDPGVSCATYGLEKIQRYWQISHGCWPADWIGWLPPVVLVVEGGIGVAYLLGLRHWAWRVAALFHLPLTVTMAPAFAFVMLAGHLAFVEESDRRSFVNAFRRHRRWLVPSALGLTYGSLRLHGLPVEASMVPKECLLWGILLWAWVTPAPNRCRHRSGSTEGLQLSPWLRRTSNLCVLVFVCNGLSPYSGLKFQHSFAMLSNLRIDSGCWNSLIAGESVRLSDEHVRIDHVYFREPGRLTEYEDIVTGGLWSPPQIRQMQRNWCKTRLRPFYVAGTFRGKPFVVEDVCEVSEPLPFEEMTLWGKPIFGDYLRFQKNLKRQCPQACLH
jgi:hypothetical protein